MKYLTNQEIFDKVSAHLLKQGERSSRGGICMYRTTDDRGQSLSCAVGCLIPDEVYSTDIETINIGGLRDDYPDVLRKSGISAKSDNLLYSLQNCHDYVFPERWRGRLEEIARERRLKFKEAA